MGPSPKSIAGPGTLDAWRSRKQIVRCLGPYHKAADLGENSVDAYRVPNNSGATSHAHGVRCSGASVSGSLPVVTVNMQPRWAVNVVSTSPISAQASALVLIKLRRTIGGPSQSVGLPSGKTCRTKKEQGTQMRRVCHRRRRGLRPCMLRNHMIRKSRSTPTNGPRHHSTK